MDEIQDTENLKWREDVEQRELPRQNVHKMKVTRCLEEEKLHWGKAGVARCFT